MIYSNNNKNADPKEKRFGIFVAIVLFCFGTYHSVLYFGHKSVPNPDFAGHIAVGRKILSLELPSSFTRAPVLGILQAGLSHITGGRYPELTAGWLVSALFHPFNLILLWLVGRKILGKSALWFAVIAGANPWLIKLMRDPTAETALLFFILVTFYLIFKRSNWSYLLASITTMVRYEGAALILTAFVMDMIYRKGKRERIRAFIYAALASMPLALWMLGTIINWQAQGPSHYLKTWGKTPGGRFPLIKYLNLTWRVGYSALIKAWPRASLNTREMLFGLNRSVASVTFVFGMIYGLYRRRWDILALLIFFVNYSVIHAFYPWIIPRMVVPVFWIAFLVSWSGWLNMLRLIGRKARIPRAVVVALGGALVIIACVWLIALLGALPGLAPISERSVSLSYVGVGVVALLFMGRVFIYKVGLFWRNLVGVSLTCLVMVSNQFTLAPVVGNGQRDIEFKRLAQWYLDHARPGEKMVCTSMANVLKIFAPEHEKNFISFFKVESPAEFVRRCYEKNITYVVWDSRLGRDPGAFYYKLYRIDNVAQLARPVSSGPFEFITQIASEGNKEKFVNVFRLSISSGRVRD